MIELDAEIVLIAFNKGLEIGFEMAVETPDLDSELNKNGIDHAE